MIDIDELCKTEEKDLKRVEACIRKRIERLEDVTITDGVHNIPINGQVIDLLESLISDIQAIEVYNNKRE